MAKLAQVIAIEKDIKAKSYSIMTEKNKIVMKADLFTGFQNNYEPIADDGEQLPPESKRVQHQMNDVVRDVERALTKVISITARKDWSNCQAVANIVVDGNTLVTDVPVTHLLFLEKQMNDLRTLIENAPVLDFAEEWTFDSNSGLHRSAVRRTHRTKKVQEGIVLYPHSVEHPAQTQLITKDVLAGHWVKTQHSGAMAAPKKRDLLERITKLAQAIKEAREAANAIDEIQPPDVAKSLFDYLLPQEE